jgi:hypothetical protein
MLLFGVIVPSNVARIITEVQGKRLNDFVLEAQGKRLDKMFSINDAETREHNKQL